MTSQEIIARLGLAPHPEGGHYRQTWVAESDGGRPAGTCIYFLLKRPASGATGTGSTRPRSGISTQARR
jgi:predicted cupin superfamily sugar epimerase